MQAAYTPEGGDTSKMWSVSATLRNFYDDNYTTAHSGAKGSYGVQLSPSFSLSVPLSQTEFGLRYTYGLFYYQERENLNQNPFDQTHQLDLWMDHAFDSRWRTKVQDSFVVAQEPELLTPGPVSVPQRVEGNNIVNTGSIKLDTDWTRLFSTSIGYQNTFYNYQQSGGTTNNPSLAGMLNRIEQTANIDFQWHATPTTVAFVGYQYGQVNYIGNEPIAPATAPPAPLVPERTSRNRDNFSHYGYIGAQHAFLENLSGSARVGVQYSDNYADWLPSTSISPYVDLSLIYTYAAGSYAQIGATQSRSATDQISLDTKNGTIAQDQESSVLYGSINYQFTPKLTGSAVAHFQYATYNQGSFNNQSDQYYSLGLNLNYAFNRYFSADLGYNFDYYTSAIPMQSYTRDRYYLGVTASY